MPAARKDFMLFYRPVGADDFRSIEMFGGHYTDATARKWAKACFPKGIEVYTALRATRETLK